MGEVNLRVWIALLSEAGVRFSSSAGMRSAVEAAAKRLDLKLEAGDLAALSDMEDALGIAASNEGDFGRMKICHIPQLEEVPSLPFPPEPDDGGRRRAATRGTVTASSLPPWGQMEEKLQALEGAIVPIDWRPADGSPISPTNWGEFFGNLVKGIDSMIWPKFGGPLWNTADIGPLLDADFELLKKLHPYLKMPINSMFPSKYTHDNFFQEEDDASIVFGANYDRYDPTLPPECDATLTTVLIAGIADKVGTLDLQLKKIFQRPRAYQVAVMQDRQKFSNRWARTGNTPSLVSGHCLQACLAGCTAFVAFAPRLTAQSVETLKQFTVDIGDRRVLAGVHYPSDNLSSWYVALTLVPYVFDGEHGAAARHFLWSAICTKSRVFKSVDKYVDAAGHSPYRKILDEIRRLGSADR